MILIRRQCERPGFEEYEDLFLCWRFKDKVKCVRVKPVFSTGMKAMISQSLKLDKDEPVEKYL